MIVVKIIIITNTDIYTETWCKKISNVLNICCLRVQTKESNTLYLKIKWLSK